MRKLIVLSFITLDGVMQAPGAPEEDTSGDFKFGGWSVGYFDDMVGNAMDEQMGHPFDLLLGRRTYDIFAGFWPKESHRPVSLDWKTTIPIHGDMVEEIKKIKAEDGPELQVHGSGDLIQTLLKHDLVDELWLKTFPVVLGTGKRLFADGAMPTGWQLIKSQVSPSGVVVASYTRAGEVKVGSFAQPDASG